MAKFDLVSSVTFASFKRTVYIVYSPPIEVRQGSLEMYNLGRQIN